MDGPVWIQQVDSAVELYELITGRKAHGILILVVPKASMKELSDLPLTATAFQQSVHKPEVVIYSYDDLGFDPGPITAGHFASNLTSPDGVA